MRFFSSMLLTAGLAVAGMTAAAWAGPVDINTADASTLAKELNGVGPARAQAIVAYRNEHGPFKSVDDLALVKNMPRKVIDSNRELLKIEGGKAGRGEGREKAAASAATGAAVKSAAKP
jgi:competence protein ComEA